MSFQTSLEILLIIASKDTPKLLVVITP